MSLRLGGLAFHADLGTISGPWLVSALPVLTSVCNITQSVLKVHGVVSGEGQVLTHLFLVNLNPLNFHLVICLHGDDYVVDASYANAKFVYNIFSGIYVKYYAFMPFTFLSMVGCLPVC